jgi:flagellar secretion chaperone FliS
MGSYQQHALESASAVDLVVALYDGIIRFLYAASAAVERGDQAGRRAAAKRALDIIIHLQARLRMDVGGRPAVALSEFYATVFAQILQASQSASKQKFEHAGSRGQSGAGPGDGRAQECGVRRRRIRRECSRRFKLECVSRRFRDCFTRQR